MRDFYGVVCVSVQRTAYKDLVLLLQENRFMTKSENRARVRINPYSRREGNKLINFLVTTC